MEMEERSVGSTPFSMEWRTSVGILKSDNISCDMVDHAVVGMQFD